VDSSVISAESASTSFSASCRYCQMSASIGMAVANPAMMRRATLFLVLTS
jgi:hypothetical protein